MRDIVKGVQILTNNSNLSKGKKFEYQVKQFFADQGIYLERPFSIYVGISDEKKPHKFDLGSETPPILVECKAHSWTETGNSPSAKLSIWNEAMYYFVTAHLRFRKILFVQKSIYNDQSLAEHYVDRYGHLIPEDVELWELDIETGQGACIYGNNG